MQNKGLRVVRRRAAAALLAFVPLAGLIMLLRLYHVDVPFLDEWEYMLILPKSYDGTLSLTDLFALHNEHRLLFPRLIMLGLARLTHWNMVYETGAAVAFAAGAFGLIAGQLRATGRQTGRDLLAIVPVLSLVHFSMSQWQNWFMPCQFLMFFNLLVVVGAIMLLSKPARGRWHLVGAMALGVMASYSFANGLSIWPIGLMCLMLTAAPRRRLPYAALWCGVGAVTVALYFHGYQSPPYHPSPWLTVRQPLGFALYMLQYLGAPIVDYSAIAAAVAGAAGLAIFGTASCRLLRGSGVPAASRKQEVDLTRRGRRVHEDVSGEEPVGSRCARPVTRSMTLPAPVRSVHLLAPYWALALYAVSGAATTGFGRLGFGIDQATSSRYITVGNLLWVCNAVLLFLLWASRPRGRAAKLAAAGIAVAFVFLAGVNSVYGTLKWTERYAFRMPARAELISGGTNEDLLQRLHPNPALVIERREILKKYRLGVFRD